MAIKTYDVKFQLFWSANNEKIVRVKANTERKAEKFATEKVIKESGWKSPILLSIKEVKEEKE